MEGFNREEIEEQILKEAPHLSNLRARVKGAGGSKVMAYAFYNHVGTPDSAFELVFDRVKKPVETTLESSLCEIYSVFGKGQEDFLKKLKKKDRIKKTSHQGPSVCGSDGLTNPGLAVRSGLSDLHFFRSAGRFGEHFNSLCNRLGYVPQLVDLYSDISPSFDENAYGVLLTQKRLAKAKLVTTGLSKDILIPIPFDFNANDPTLGEALDKIEKAYRKGLEAKSKYFTLI